MSSTVQGGVELPGVQVGAGGGRDPDFASATVKVLWDSLQTWCRVLLGQQLLSEMVPFSVV